MSSRRIESIISAQVKRWELAQRKRAEMAPDVAMPTAVITLSRQFGAQAGAVAHAVAEQLGFELWDKELVHAIAESSGVTDQLVATLDEHTRGGLEEFVASFKATQAETTLDYAQSLGRVVGTIARHGAAVIVGRGAQFMVGSQRSLHVRIIQSLDKRAEAYAKRQVMSAHEAERAVDQAEAERLAFCRQHFGEDASDPRHYDLVINRDAITKKAAAAIVVTAFRAKFPE